MIVQGLIEIYLYYVDKCVKILNIIYTECQVSHEDLTIMVYSLINVYLFNFFM